MCIYASVNRGYAKKTNDERIRRLHEMSEFAIIFAFLILSHILHLTYFGVC
jgi:hypothetical protein